jgi:Putative Flp pilus-assembly TadE/G-like/von Willebrand factor type A domain
MRGAAAVRGRVRPQDGSVLVLVVLAMVVLLGFTGMVIDLGRVWVAQRQLQAAVDASALVAGQNLPNATSSYSSALSYGGTGKNAVGGYGVTANAPSVTFQCVSHAPNYTSGSSPTCPADTSNTNCQPTGAQPTQPTGATTCNAVHVTETAKVKTTFLSLFLPSFTVSASATAGARGGVPHPLNVYVILDNTQSMTDNCTSSVTGISGTPQRLDCAKAGVRALLQALWPCDSSLASCGSATPNTGGQLGANVAAPVDEVGMLVYPAISGNPPSTSTLNKEVDCSSSSTFNVTYPQWNSYTYNSALPDGGIPSSDVYSGYQAVALSSDYRPSVANPALNWTSNLVESVDWGQCSGSKYPGGNYYGLKDIGGQGSYLAGAITEAQHLLDQNARPGATNAIIVESDGQLTKPKTFTDNNPCNSAIQAATQAKAAGTTIYSIAYGDDGTKCPDTNYSYTDTQTMQGIASNAETFFNQPTPGDLTQTFQQVGTDLTDSALIPDCTAAPPGC